MTVLPACMYEHCMHVVTARPERGLEVLGLNLLEMVVS